MLCAGTLKLRKFAAFSAVRHNARHLLFTWLSAHSFALRRAWFSWRPLAVAHHIRCSPGVICQTHRKMVLDFDFFREQEDPDAITSLCKISASLCWEDGTLMQLPLLLSAFVLPNYDAWIS